MRFTFQPCLSFALTVIVYVAPFTGLNLLTAKVFVWSAASVTRGWPSAATALPWNTNYVTPMGVPGVS